MDSISTQLIALENPDYRVRRDACEQLGLQADLPQQAVVALQRALRDSDLRVAEAARRALQIDRALPPSPGSPGRSAPDSLKFLTRSRTSGANMWAWLWFFLIAGIFLVVAVMGWEESQILLVFSVFVVAGLLILRILAAPRRRKLMDAWGEVATQTGLQLEPGRPKGILGAASQPSLAGIYRGRTVSFSMIPLNRWSVEVDGAPTHTRIRLQVGNPAACWLYIHPAGLPARIFRRGLAVSGYPDFDRRFRFGGSPPNFLHRTMQLLPRYPVLLGRQDGVMMPAAGPFLTGTRGLPSIYLEGSTLESIQPGAPGNAYSAISILNFLSELADLAEHEAADHLLSRPVPPPEPSSAVRAPVRPASGTGAPRMSLPTILLILFSLIFGLLTELPGLFKPRESPGPVGPVSMPEAASAQETQIVAMRSTDVARFVTTATAQVAAGASARATGAAMIRSTYTARAVATGQSRKKLYMATVEASMQNPDGPYSGSLKHDSSDGAMELRALPRKLKNFVAQATFLNPYSASETGPWAYGFVFRDDSVHERHYRLILKSNGHWELRSFHGGSLYTLGGGRLPEFNTDKNGSNKVWLMARDDKGLLFVNGVYVSDLKLSSTNLGVGQIAIATGMVNGGAEIDGYSTGYEDFTVWQIP